MKKTLKKLTALFAALLMCGSPLLEFPDGSFRLDLSAWAAEETEHTEHSYDNGFCTSCQALQPAEQNAEATYEIGNAGQLFWFAALVNGTLTDGTEQNTAANAELTADITVNKYVVNEDGSLNEYDADSFRPWTPIGSYYGTGEKNRFKGALNGKGHTVRGLYMQKLIFGVGLVGAAGASASISNIRVVDSYFSGRDYVGGICGVIENGSDIVNCSFAGSVTADNSVGGICGRAVSTNIERCYANSTVTNSLSYLGGICGSVDSASIDHCYFNKERFSGEVVSRTVSSTITNSSGESAAEVASGRIAYLLQEGQSEPFWGQKLGEDSDPMLGGAKVYQVDVYSTCDKAGEPGVGYSNTDQPLYSQHVDYEAHNGFCVCGATPQAAAQNAEGYYEISNPGQLYWFAGLVNGTLTGVSRNTSANAVLTADITINENVMLEDGTLNAEKTAAFRPWSPLGDDYMNPYAGNFNGGNHTISGLYLDMEQGNGGFIGILESGRTVSDLTIADSYFKAPTSVGGICSVANGNIQNCHNGATLSGTASGGGICGQSGTGTVISGCTNTGRIFATYFGGGICGYSGKTATIKNCFNSGSVSAGGCAGGICGSGYDTYYIQNCANIGTVTNDQDCASICGQPSTSSSTGQGAVITDCYYLETAAPDANAESLNGEAFSSGKAAYLLQGSQPEQAWGQKLGTDAYPIPGSPDIVYKNGIFESCELEPVVVYGNTRQSVYNGHGGYASHNGFCACGETIQPALQNEAGAYEIGNTGQLLWFAKLVNGALADVEQNLSANAVLTADIVLNENLLNDQGELNEGTFRPWTPMGTEDTPYTGSFDGQVHAIKGIYLNESGTDNAGLFRASNGTIANLRLVDCYVIGQRKVGAVCGLNNGTICNCAVSGMVTGTINVGGICGYMEKNGVVENCLSDARVTATNYVAGGICGSSGGIIRYCLVLGSVSGNTIQGGICGDYLGMYAIIQNSYFNSDVFDGKVIQYSDNCEIMDSSGKTAAELASGEVACQLGEAWGQNIDNGETVQDIPVLGGARVYLRRIYTTCAKSDTPVTVYSNTNGDQAPAHDLNNGFCETCGYMEPAVQNAEGTYEIGNAGQMYWFAGLVNGTLESVEQKRSANAVLTADIVLNKHVLNDAGELNQGTFRPWTPMGISDVPYMGVFDGQGHAIQGMYLNESGTDYVGFFRSASGTIVNLCLDDFYVNGQSKVGGLCGRNSGTIKECYTYGLAVGESYLGGICGWNCNSGVVEHCINDAWVTGTESTIEIGGICGVNDAYLQGCANTASLQGDYNLGGVCGSNNQSITNCYNTGDLEGLIGVGGVCGLNTGSLVCCYSFCNVTGNENVGGIAGLQSTKGAVEVCYFNSDLFSGSVFGGEDGKMEKSSPMTADAFASGEVAYLFQSRLLNSPWGQLLGMDPMPTLYNPNIVYKNQAYDSCELEAGTVYGNAPAEPVYNGHGGYESRNGFCACGKTVQPAVLNDNMKYEISNAGQLYWFAGLVNGTLENVDQNRYANAVLTANITVNQFVLSGGALSGEDHRKWTPIGTPGAAYAGTFDGNGYSISGLYVNDADLDHVGLFGMSEGKICNVRIMDSYLLGRIAVGAVCGYNDGTIQQCAVEGVVKGSTSVGGICGVNDSAILGHIQNCQNAASVSADANAGGICGRNDGTIQRCCSVGQVTSNLYAGGISGINDTEGSIEICFYNSDVFSGDGIGTETGKSKDVLGKNAAELYSGEVAYFLQSGQSGEIWGQDLDNGKIHQSEPSLDGEKVYQYLTYEDCNNQAPYTVSYSNTALQDTFRGHVYENGKCKYCDFFENQVGAHLAGYSLSLGGNIGVRFYMELDPRTVARFDSYMLFTLPDGQTKKIYVSDAISETRNNQTYYIFNCEVAPKEMTAPITAQMYAGSLCSELYTFTVADYADYIFDHENQYSAETVALTQEILRYGAYAKAYFDGDTLGAAEEMRGITADTLADANPTVSGTLPEGITYYGSSLLLESDMILRHYFKVKTDVDVSQYGFSGNKGEYYYMDQQITPGRTAADCVIGDYTLHYDTMCYVHAVLASPDAPENLQQLAAALYLYNQAAAAYLKNVIG